MTGFTPPSALQDRIGPLQPMDLGNDSTPITRDRPREYAALQRTLVEHNPACAGDPRFTADPATLSDSDSTAMRRACRSCDVSAACDAYAAAARPSAGMWAGIQYHLTESENA